MAFIADAELFNGVLSLLLEGDQIVTLCGDA
jgi:hypothetical protein